MIKRKVKKNVTVMLTIFLKKTKILLDVFQKDKNLQSEMKKSLLKMAEVDYQ